MTRGVARRVRFPEGRRLGQAGLVLALGVVVLLAWRFGLLDDLSPQALRERTAAAGAWGPPLFVVLFAVAEVLHVPAVAFVLVASWLWPLPLALASAWIGAVVAATTVFSISRYLLADYVRGRIPARVQWMDERLVGRGIRSVALVRLLTFMMPLSHWVLGVSRVSFRDALVGTALGLLPGVIVIVVLGERFTEGWDAARPWLVTAVVLWVAVRALRWLRARRAERVRCADPPARALPGPPAAEVQSGDPL